MCNVGILLNGATKTIDILVKVKSDTTGTLSNSASVDGDNDGDAAATDPLVSNVVTSADLSVTKSCLPSGTIAFNDSGTCTIQVTNNGPSDAANVKLTDHITSTGAWTITGFSAPSTPSDCGVSLPMTSQDTTLSCTFPSIASGASVQALFVMKNAETHAISVNDTATVSADTADPNTSNNTASAGLSFAGPSADLQVTKLCKPDTSSVIAGSSGTCQLLVKNWGPNDATNVVLSDNLVSNGQFTITNITRIPAVGTCPNTPIGPTTSTTVTCTLGTLSAGATWEVDLTITSATSADVDDTATVSSDTPDPTNANNTATGGLTFLLSADLQITKLCKPDVNQLPAGSNGTCQLLVKNWGPSAAANVHVIDHLISNGTFRITSINQPGPVGTCNPNSFPTSASTNQTVDCTLASLAAGAIWEIDIGISSDFGVDVDDTAFVSSDVSDPNTGNNTATGGLTFTASADLQVTKSADPAGSVVAGTSVTYTVTVKNNGPSLADDVVVTDTLPAGVTFDHVVGGFPTAGSITPPPAGPGGTLTWSVGDLASGADEILQFVVIVNPQTTGPIVNQACASSQTSDPVNTNNCASTTNGTTANAVLNITKTHITNPVNAGSDLTYTIVVSNTGPSTAVNVVVTDPLPAGTTFVSGVDGSNNVVCTQVVAGLVSCNVGTLDPGQSKTIFLTVHIKSNVPDGSQITNCARASSPTDSGGPRQACDPTDISTEADLWVDKQGTAPAQNPSGAIYYAITVHNSSGFVPDDTPTSGDGGPSDAQNVVVTDHLPLDPKKMIVQYLSPSCTYSAGTHTVTCHTTTLKAGTNVTYTIQVQVKGTQKFTLINTAPVTSDTDDPDTSNNSDTVTNVVQGSTGKGKKP